MKKQWFRGVLKGVLPRALMNLWMAETEWLCLTRYCCTKRKGHWLLSWAHFSEACHALSVWECVFNGIILQDSVKLNRLFYDETNCNLSTQSLWILWWKLPYNPSQFFCLQFQCYMSGQRKVAFSGVLRLGFCKLNSSLCLMLKEWFVLCLLKKKKLHDAQSTLVMDYSQQLLHPSHFNFLPQVFWSPSPEK